MKDNKLEQNGINQKMVIRSLHDELEHRGLIWNGITDGVTHYCKDLKVGYIYVWVDESNRKYSVTHNKTGMAVGAEHTYKSSRKLLVFLNDLGPIGRDKDSI